MHLVKFQFYMLYNVYQFFLKWTSFRTSLWHLFFYSSIACVNTITQLTISYVLHCLLLGNKHFLDHLKLFKKFLTTFWTTKTG